MTKLHPPKPSGDNDHKMTYHVGWRSGTIRNTRPEMPGGWGRLASLLMKPAPPPAEKALTLLLTAVVPAAFAVLLWLSYLLLL